MPQDVGLLEKVSPTRFQPIDRSMLATGLRRAYDSLPMALQSKTQRSLLLGFITSIACCGLVGIFCLLQGSLGRLEGRVLATTGTVAAVSILALAAAIPTHRRSWHPIGPIGMIVTIPALCITLFAIWINIFNVHYEEMLWKTMGVAWVVAVAFPLIGLLSLARLKKQWNWMRRWTAILILFLASLIIISIIDFVFIDDWGRLTGIVSILVTCGIITVPVLHRISVIPVRQDVKTTDMSLTVTCPRCGKTQSLPIGHSKCAQCELKFSIEIQEEHCRQCGYPLYTIQSAVCPECGTPIAREGTAGQKL